MKIEVSEELYLSITGIVSTVPILTEDAVVAIALRLGIDAWKKDPKILVDMLRIGTGGKKTSSTRAPRKPRSDKGTKKAEAPTPPTADKPVTKVRSANKAGDAGFKGKPPKPQTEGLLDMTPPKEDEAF